MKSVTDYIEHDQVKWPLATLILHADASPVTHRVRLLALARREASARGHKL